MQFSLLQRNVILGNEADESGKHLGGDPATVGESRVLKKGDVRE
jgi:hypothetical protein